MGKFFLKIDAKILKQTKIIYSNAFYKHTYSFLYGGKLDLHTLFQPTFITHIPSLSLPSCFRTPFFCKAERSRSMVRWLTDKVSDICLPVIVGESLMRLRIFCWRSVSFVSDMSPSWSPTFGVSEEAKMMVWNWVGVDLNLGFSSSL